MKDAVQFSVTKLSSGDYKVVVQDMERIVRSSEVSAFDIMNHLNRELTKLRPVND